MKIGLIGKNIGYSKSKEIFETTYGCQYDVFDIEPQQLSETIYFMKNNGYSGFNITKPYKSDIIKFLDNDTYGINSVNCVKFQNNQMIGRSFDGIALLDSIYENNVVRQNLTQWKYLTVAIIGNGGVVPSILEAFRGCFTYIYARNQKEFNKSLLIIKQDTIENFHLGYFDIVINTIPHEANINLDLKQKTLRNFVFVDLNYTDWTHINNARENPKCIHAMNGYRMLEKNAELTYDFLKG